MICQIEFVSSDSDIGMPCSNPAVATCADCGCPFVPTAARGVVDNHSVSERQSSLPLAPGQSLTYKRSEKTGIKGTRKRSPTILRSRRMSRPSRNYYQIYRVDHKRNQEQMVAEVEGLHEAERLVEKYLRNMSASEKKDEISYYRSTLSSSVPKMFGLSRAS